MNKKILEFTDLKTWQLAHKLVLDIYLYSKNYPNEEKYGLTNQLRRSAVSITSNIAEGFGRQYIREKIHFYYLSQGSLVELKNQLIISKDLKYISIDKFKKLYNNSDEVHKLIRGLIRSNKKFL